MKDIYVCMYIYIYKVYIYIFKVSYIGMSKSAFKYIKSIFLNLVILKSLIWVYNKCIDLLFELKAQE